MSAQLHMVSLDLHKDKLYTSARRSVSATDIDLGYLVHSQLAALFAGHAPKPFSVTQKDRFVHVLGYCESDAETLKRMADETADPRAHVVCAWDQTASKPIPERWSEGRELGFEVRVCPVTRLASARANHKKGAEVDVFLSECWNQGPATRVDRSNVYAEWLAKQVEHHGGARVAGVTMKSFQLNRLLRQTQGEARKARLARRPDVVLEGRIIVSDSEAFSQLLRRGVGRHRAFGFGMLLLRP